MVVRAIRGILLYYVSGFIITFLVHLLVGWEIKALMPRSIVVMLLFILGALPWFFLNLINLLVPCKRVRSIQELLAHSVFLSVMLAVVIVAGNSN